MTQLSSTASTCAAQWKMWLVKIFSVIYFTAVCAAPGSQDGTPIPTLKLLSPWQDVFENEAVEFSCEDSSHDWVFTWYRNQKNVTADEDQNLEEDHSSLNITSVTRSHQGVYACKALPEDNNGHSSAFSNTVNVTVYEKTPKPTVSKVPGFNPMYVGETVNFTCKVHVSSGWKYEWYRDGNKLPDTNETISIHLGISEKGEYWCKATRGETTSTNISEKIQQDVLGIPVPSLKLVTSWLDVFPTERVKLSCVMDGTSDWTYTWYREGQQVLADGTVSFDSNGATLSISSASAAHAGQYNCKGHLKDRSVSSNSSSGLTVKVYDKKPTVILTQDPEYKVMFPGESVSFGCHINVSTGWEYLWYKDSNQLTVSGNKYPISLVGITNSGSYTCKAKRGSDQAFITDSSQAVRLEVEGNMPKPSMTQQPDVNKVYTGESVSFKCEVKLSSGWLYLWYKDGTPLPINSSSFNIHNATSSNSGTYKCMAIRDKTTYSTEHSDSRILRVSEIPVPSLKLVTPWLDVFPTERVKLSCVMDGTSDWTYTWYRDGQQVLADGTVSFDSNGATLSISSASAAHVGQYSCKGHLNDRSVSSNSSPGLTLKVYDKKPTVILTQDPEYKVMFPGESVSFGCHINVSTGWEYLWYKDSNQLTVSGNKYPISLVGITNSGSYTCKAKRGSDQAFITDSSQAVRLEVEGNKPKPSMTQQPDVNKVYTGESVSFKCEVKLSSGWLYLWYKDGTPLPINSSSFNIHNATSSNSGTYKCMAIRDKTTYSTEHSDSRILRVSEIPVPSVKLVTPWLDVFPTERVKLSCVMNGTSDWTYTWYRDGQQVLADGTVIFDSDAATLSISSAAASHRGQYSCSGKLKSRSVSSTFSSVQTLGVYDTKPRVTLMQNPMHNVMHTGDSVSFSCHINVSSGWEYLWYRDDNQLVVSGNNHTISSVLRTNTGSYHCKVKRGIYAVQSQAVKLDIEERPLAYITLLTGWSEVFSTDSLVLRCRVLESQDIWNYTWFKEGHPINFSLSEKHTVTPENDPEQSLYTCKGIRTGRPSYSKTSDSFHTKNLLLKRRVLLSISGFIFFAIIAIFIGCIFLRFIRKPGNGEDKPEETELFLTMAQLKDRDDALCPLVQYITDAELNASSKKEADENGTISDETTPLPISSQEDQAVTSESHDTTENNGGLVSFKQ
ncbi:titin-like isoform X1 [Sander lucioperca]|nr:titin-like isoform X1 [Sander lucioperca]